MRKVLCVEPVIFTYIFACLLTSPLVQQFIYRRLWEEEYNSTFVSSGNASHCEQNKSSPTYIKQKSSANALAQSVAIRLLEMTEGTRFHKKYSRDALGNENWRLDRIK